MPQLDLFGRLLPTAPPPPPKQSKAKPNDELQPDGAAPMPKRRRMSSDGCSEQAAVPTGGGPNPTRTRRSKKTPGEGSSGPLAEKDVAPKGGEATNGEGINEPSAEQPEAEGVEATPIKDEHVPNQGAPSDLQETSTSPSQQLFQRIFSDVFPAPGETPVEQAVSVESPVEQEAAVAPLVKQPPPNEALVYKQPELDQGTLVYKQPELPKHELSCTKCGHVVNPLHKGVRVMKKSPPEFCCGGCNSKTVMLNRMFGTWPLVEFRGLSNSEQLAFWKDQCNDSEGLKRAVEKHIVTKQVETELASRAGPFLPLSVWAAKGFDPEDIKAKATFRYHEVLGDTYQVLIESSGQEKRRELIQTHMAKLLGRCKKGPLAIEGATEPLAIEGAPEQADASGGADAVAEGTSSSSSSSSSSSDSKSKKKKARKTKRARRTKRRRTRRTGRRRIMNLPLLPAPRIFWLKRRLPRKLRRRGSRRSRTTAARSWARSPRC